MNNLVKNLTIFEELAKKRDQVYQALQLELNHDRRKILKLSLLSLEKQAKRFVVFEDVK